MARRGPGPTEIYEDDRDRGRAAARPTCCGRVYDETGRLRRLRVARGDARPRARRRRHARRRRATTGSRVDRPNVMIKIPGTDEGVPGDRAGDLRGHQRQRHAAVLGRGLREGRRGATSSASSGAREAGESLDVHSVASFFVSRVDTEVDKRLEELGPHRPRRARAGGRQRAAPPTCASRRSSAASASPSCTTPARRVQRPLWASTGVKNPHYRDTMYVEELVGAATP